MLATAIREFNEETGLEARGPFLELGSIRQRSGKTVYAWAFSGDWDGSVPIRSLLMTLEWPPGSGRMQRVPEVDRAQFFSLGEARRKLKDRQCPLLDRLEAALRQASTGLGAA